MGEHHDHHHEHEHQGDLSFDQKLIKLFEHWIKHNTEHAKSYRDWAAKAKENGRDDVAKILEEVADITVGLNKKFEEIHDIVHKH